MFLFLFSLFFPVSLFVCVISNMTATTNSRSKRVEKMEKEEERKRDNRHRPIKRKSTELHTTVSSSARPLSPTTLSSSSSFVSVWTDVARIDARALEYGCKRKMRLARAREHRVTHLSGRLAARGRPLSVSPAASRYFFVNWFLYESRR